MITVHLPAGRSQWSRAARLSMVLALLLASASCGRERAVERDLVESAPSQAAPTEPAPSARAEVVTIASNALATFGDVKIGVGNIRIDAPGDGAARGTRSAGLWISVGDDESQNRRLRVRAGEQLAVAGRSFEVRSVGAREVELVVLR